MRLKIFLFVAYFVTVSAQATESGFELSIYYFDSEIQQAMREELIKAEIPHKVDEGGAVWYRFKDQRKVEVLREKVLKEAAIGSFAASYASRDEEKLVTDALEKNGIQYQIKERGGRRWIIWSPEDDAKVKRIDAEVRDESLKKLAEERKRKGKTGKER